MARASSSVNPLARGFYTVSEATRLIRGANARRIHGWLRGYPGRQIGPLLHRDYRPLDGREELSFLDLIEVRLVEKFRATGVTAVAMRKAAENAREMLGTEHPFASEKITFRTDRKTIYLQRIFKKSAEETRDVVLLNLVTNQLEIYEAIERSLLKGIQYDAESHFVGQWRPRPEEFPRIIVDPRIAYGKPAGPTRIPTETLFDSWRAESEDYDRVAFWFDVPPNDVREAVEFERSLAA